MEVEQLRPRLWRWTALHPDWTPEQGGPDGWAQEVASFALVEEDALVLFDPLVPNDDEERFWRSLDADARDHGPPQILLTVHWHARSAQRIAQRYEGARVLAIGDELPAGIEARPTAEAEEVVFWIQSHRALVAGDVLLGTEQGGVRLTPDGWLNEGTTREQVRDALLPLLDLPVELVLLTHGEPVRADAHAALAAALS